MKRRNLLLGLGGLAGAGGAVGTGAFSSITANRDVTVSVADDTDALLKLKPSPTANGEYATNPKQNGGLIALDFTETEEGGKGLGTDSVYTFDDVFRVTNQGTQPVYVWGTFGGGSESFTAGGEDTDIWLYPDGGSTTKLRDKGDGVVRLGVGKTVHVGVYVDTQDVTNDQTLSMTIHADAEKPAGAPGTTKPYPPISVEKKQTSQDTRYFHALPDALAYASGSDNVEIEIKGGTYPRAESAMRFTDPSDTRQWLEFPVDDRDWLEFTGNADSDYSVTIQRNTGYPSREAWLAYIKDSSGDTSLLLGLSELLSGVTTTPTEDTDGTSLSFGGSGSITYPGSGEDDSFVFTGPSSDDTLSFVPTPNENDDGIERIILTTADGTLSFSDPAAIAGAPSLVTGDQQELSMRVPGTVKIEGQNGRPSIGHALMLKTTAAQEGISIKNLVFETPPDQGRNGESLAIDGPTGVTVSNLRFDRVEFAPRDNGRQIAEDGLRITAPVNVVNGLIITDCTFAGRGTGVNCIGTRDNKPAKFTQLEIAGTSFSSNDNGMAVGAITEGYIHDTEFVNNYEGLRLNDPDGLGLEKVHFKNNESVAFEYSGDVSAIDDEEPLADQIETDVGNGDRRKSGIVNSTFVNNGSDDVFGDGLNVKGFGLVDKYPVAKCKFQPPRTGDDINDYTR